MGDPPSTAMVPLPLARLTLAIAVIAASMRSAIRALDVLWQSNAEESHKHGLLLLIPENVSWAVAWEITKSHGLLLTVFGSAVLLLFVRTPAPLRRLWERQW